VRRGDPEERPINISQDLRKLWSYYRRRNSRKCLQDDWYPSMDSSISLRKQRDRKHGTRTQISNGERRKKWKQKYQSRNESSAVVAERMEGYASLKKSLTSSRPMPSSPYSCEARKHKHKALDRRLLLLLQEGTTTKKEITRLESLGEGISP